MTIKIDRDQLEQKIKETIRRAEGWCSQGGSGECQLYGKYDKEGNIYDFFIADFAGHNSWIEGDNIVCLFVQKWFDWNENEHLGEWLENELDEISGDNRTREAFIRWLKENDYYNEDYDENKNIQYNWDHFQEFNEEKWDEYMENWREIWLDIYGDEMVREAMRSIVEGEGIEFI